MIDGLLGGLKQLIGLLPDLDLTNYIDSAGGKLQEYLGYLNWVLPIGTVAKIEMVWLACIGTYFAYVTFKPVLMKWLKTLL